MNIKEEFSEKIHILKKPMYFLAYSVLKNEADAADAVSEAVCKAYENYPFLKNKGSFKPWIMKIVHNTAVEMIRKNRKTMSIDETVIKQEDTADASAIKLALNDAVKTLSQPYQTVVLLYYYNDFSVSQIAEITGSNQNAVKKQLSRAREKLRDILKEDLRYE